MTITALQLLTICVVVLNRVQPEPHDSIVLTTLSILCCLEILLSAKSKP